MIVMNSHELFILLDYISIFVMLFCCVVINTHSGSRMQKLAFLVCVCLTICCIGFLFRAEAASADEYILGQKLVYMFVTHGMFLMLLFILEYCRISIPKGVEYFFHILNFMITFIVLTMNYHTLFYKSYWVVPMEGYIDLEKEYGFMHTLAVGLFALYIIAAIVIALYFSSKNIKTRSTYVWRLLFAVSLPCISYIIPKITGSHNDFQPMTFAAFSLMVIYMIYKNKLYDIENIVSTYSMASMDDALMAFDNKYHFKGCNEAAEKLFPGLKKSYLDTNISNDFPIIKKMLDSKMIEYVVGDRIYKVTVRSIDDGNVQMGKVVKLNDITLQHNYTELLQTSRDKLKDEVATLTNYSYTDELTGLQNRRSFENEISEIKRNFSLEPIAVCAVDLNGLKNVNDTIGHVAGDELISGAASILSEVFASYGKLFRTGGDEFYVIMNPIPENLESLVEELEEKMHEWKGELVDKLSFSYGFALSTSGRSSNIDQLLIEADKSMYAYKRNYYMTLGNDRRCKR